MITRRPAHERFHTKIGWLDSRHTVSFAEHHDPRHMGFGPLRVINEDRVAPGQGFGTHPHQDMEIVTYVLEGALRHADSMGNGSIIRPGEVQRMSAGTGVRHSEHNDSAVDEVHFLQIWIVPSRRGIAPSYEQRAFAPEERKDRLRLVASSDGRDGSVTIHQDARIYDALLAPATRVAHALAPGRRAWIQVVAGAVAVDGVALHEGDGAAVDETRELLIEASRAAEILLFDLP